MGGMLKKIPKQHGARPADTELQTATPPTLEDLGIEKTAAHRYQTMAVLPRGG